MVAFNCCCSSRNRPASRPVSRLHHAANNKHSSQLGKPGRVAMSPQKAQCPKKIVRHTFTAATSSKASR
jgi:hypothetical protein